MLGLTIAEKYGFVGAFDDCLRLFFKFALRPLPKIIGDACDLISARNTHSRAGYLSASFIKTNRRRS